MSSSGLTRLSARRPWMAAVRGGGDAGGGGSVALGSSGAAVAMPDSSSSSEVLVDMEYEPPRPLDRMLASTIGLLAALVPMLAHGLVTSRGTVRPPSGAATALREAALALLRLVVGTLTSAFFIREMRQSARLVDVREAAYPDSRFTTVGGLTVHYFEVLPSSSVTTSAAGAGQVETAAATGRGMGKETGVAEENNAAEGRGDEERPVVLIVHGFGASAAACRAPMQSLADRLGARVLAVDMPGFGLTERPRRTADFDAERMLEGFVQALGLAGGRRRLFIVGHSLGGLVAARFITRPGSPAAAAVLVAPAIQTPRSAVAAAAGTGGGAKAVGLAKSVPRVAQAGALYVVQAVIGLLAPLVTAALRCIVYSRVFWVRGIGAAYFDPGQLAAETVEHYRRASRVRGWDAGLVRFVQFRATGGRGLLELLHRAVHPPEGVPRLLASAGRPVLLVHGESDRVIPAANSRELSRVVGAQYVELPRCGHCPLEESPAALVDVVAAFLAKLL